ncbi:two-component system sensor histidine kinase PmrB [Zophobihabitans entericus]|uniref:histidine kinase n=1 Tax=Zophobihabitans entericus TaxID=1635327 RepID=A0A6G9IDP0_9GAMM|nr:two-component system sensor histidine kinase PmrB [Zophobihabitans entericus]QIQ21929.1 two-component system sensor histidine kinase PmrB [Zophobihabitans entericus]
MKSLSKARYSIRWNLFFLLAVIMFISQTITVLWLWHESKEQIAALVDLTLTPETIDEIIHREELEAIFALFLSTFTMMAVTLFLSYKAIKWIVKPLETLKHELVQRTADNLTPMTNTSKMNEIQSISLSLNDLFLRLSDTLQQERLFTADVAHELRTPLAGIRLHLELMEKAYNVDAKELIERIDRLVSTVEQLLLLARASQKFTVGEYQKIHFEHDVAIPLFDELFELTQQKDQQLVWQIPDKQISFDGDAILIRLLIRNLVENAYRYSPSESTITVSCIHHEQGIMIEVKDEGTGIDESKAELLQQAFFRMDRRHKGIGLGLSIVNRITKLHHGQFFIKNRHDGHSGTIAQFVNYPAEEVNSEVKNDSSEH